MDLLGSILDSMDKPPEIDDKRKEQMKSIDFSQFYLITSFFKS